MGKSVPYAAFYLANCFIDKVDEVCIYSLIGWLYVQMVYRIKVNHEVIWQYKRVTNGSKCLSCFRNQQLIYLFT